MASLTPTIASPLPLELQQTTAAPVPAYPRAPLWNFVLGDFVRDSSGHVTLTNGLTAWQQWCQKVAITQKRQARVYASWFAVDHALVLGLHGRGIIQAEYQTQLTAALKADPRTQDVVSFAFAWPALNTIQVTFTPVAWIGPGQPITTTVQVN